MKRASFPFLFLALWLALALVAAACGGGDGATARPAPVPTPTSTAAPAEPQPVPTPTSTPVVAQPTPTSTSTPVPAQPTPTPTGPPEIYNSAQPIGCSVCHSLDGTTGLGPTWQGVATAAATRVSGKSAEEYLRESILDTGAFVVEGFPDGLMPQTFADTLTPDQIDDLVAFLLTLK